MEKMEPEKLTSSQLRHTIIAFLFRITRAIFLAALPAIAFWAFQQTSLALTGTLRDYIIFGLFLWILLSFLVVLDSSLSTKISTIKDIASFLLPFGIDHKP